MPKEFFPNATFSHVLNTLPKSESQGYKFLMYSKPNIFLSNVEARRTFKIMHQSQCFVKLAST